MVKTTTKAAKASAPKAKVEPLAKPIVSRINSLVRAYASADGTFQRGVITLAEQAGRTTEADWNARYAPVFSAAFDKYSVGSAHVMRGRVKSLFLCAANGVLPNNDAGQPVVGLHTAADATRREALAKAKVIQPVGTGKGSGAAKRGANKRQTETPTAANDKGNLLDPASVKPGKAYTEADMRGAGIILTGTPKLASELAALLCNDKDAPADFKKLVRTFIDGRRA